MASLRQIIKEIGPVLLLDAASSRIQVGWFESATRAARWESSLAEAGIGLFECLQRLAIDPNDANAFIFCEGPGSILGIRTSAVAIRMWNVAKARRVFAYQSLRLVAESLERADARVIADARRDSWHTLIAGKALTRVSSSELTGALVTPEGFRNWTPLPAGTSHTPYVVEDRLARLVDAGIFRETESPDAFLHEEPAYVKWSPQIHRAP